MSQKKHKGNHASREERRAAARREAASTPTSIDKPRRIHLRNWLYIFLTTLVVIGVFAVMIVLHLLFDFWDSLVGNIVFVALAAFGCACIYDIGLLFSACIAFGEGMVSAGKNDEGTHMVFHAASVVRMELRDTTDHVLPEDQAVYKNIVIAFVMESGRVNRKKVTRLTSKQLAAIKDALAVERRYDEMHGH